jgi:hypothetical protein
MHGSDQDNNFRIYNLENDLRSGKVISSVIKSYVKSNTIEQIL